MATLAVPIDDSLAGAVVLAAAGDETAFARIIQAHHGDMTRVCFLVSGGLDVADDAVQATPAAYGLNQPDCPSAVMTISPFRGASDVWNNDPPSPGTGFTQIQQLVSFFGGSRKVTFMVVSGGTTLGVTVPHCCATPVSPSSATNNVAGSELLLRTVTIHFRPPGTTNGVGVGLGVAVGVGLGVAVGVAVGTATAA